MRQILLLALGLSACGAPPVLEETWGTVHAEPCALAVSPDFTSSELRIIERAAARLEHATGTGVVISPLSQLWPQPEHYIARSLDRYKRLERARDPAPNERQIIVYVKAISEEYGQPTSASDPKFLDYLEAFEIVVLHAYLHHMGLGTHGGQGIMPEHPVEDGTGVLTRWELGRLCNLGYDCTIKPEL